MARKTRNLTKPARPRARTIPLGAGASLEVVPGAGGARLRVLSSGDGAGLDLEIVMTERGPTLRVRAAALEFETAGDVVTRCRSFSVEASGSIAMRAGGAATVEGSAVTVEARTGMARVVANDDVQLMGEQVLLNCERQGPMPSWVNTLDAPALLPAAASSGDAGLLEALAEGGSKPRCD